MTEQKQMEKEYEALIEKRAELKGMANKSKYKEIQERVGDLSRGLKESTSKLVASLKENPNVSGNMIKVDKDRRELLDLFLRVNQELRDKGSANALINYVDEEDAAIFRLKQLHLKDKELSDAIAKLEEDLKSENDSFQWATRERKETVISLKEDIHRVKSNTSTNTQFKKRESLAKVASIVRDFKLAERVLEIKTRELEEQLRTEQVVNQETRTFLTRKQASLVDTISDWEGRFERESAEKERELKKILHQRALLVEKLTALQDRKKAEIALQKEGHDKQFAEREMSRHKEVVMKSRSRAANTIFQLMRLYMNRKKEAEKVELNKKKKISDGKKTKK